MRLSERDRRIAALAIPALGTLAVEPLYVLVDTAIVGHLGTVPLGGLALASAVLTTLLPVFNFLSYGTTARAGFLTGAGDRAGAAGIASQGLWLCGLIGVPLAVGVFAGGHLLVGALGGSGAVAGAAVTYLRISAVGVPFVLVALVGNGYLRALSDVRSPLGIAVVANVLNVVLELVFVYRFRWGVAGSAWGTVIAQVVAAVWFLVLLGRQIGAASGRLDPIRREMARLLVAGRHLFVRTAALLATLALATSVASRLGPAVLGGHQVTLQVHSFIALALDALAIPGQILVATLLGAGNRAEAHAVSDRLLKLGALAGAVVAVALLAAAPFLPRLFSGDGRVRHTATVALVVAAAVQVPAALAFVLDGILIGANDFRYLQRSMLIGFAVFAPFAVAVLRWHRLGVAGIWCGLLAWMTARAIANVTRYHRSHRLRIG
jgi:putative MATE family efflux protein